MNLKEMKGPIIGGGVVLLLLLLVLSNPFIMVGDEEVGVVFAKFGNAPEQGRVLAKSGESGPREDVLAPGFHFYPTRLFAYDFEIVPMTKIDAGKIAVLTALDGTALTGGRIIADDGEKGIQREVLMPGRYPLNPKKYKIDIRDMKTIPAGQVGVLTRKTGTESPEVLVARESEFKGIIKEYLAPGTYPLNPHIYDIDAVSTQEQYYTMSTSSNINGETKDDDAIGFLSNDGFMITIDFTVKYKIEPNKAPFVIANVGKTTQEIINKIIRPQARSISRNLGGTKKAEDFLDGATRKEFQDELHAELQMQCRIASIEVMDSLVRNFTIPSEITGPIQQKRIAEKEMQMYTQQQETAKEEAKLKKEKELVTQEKRMIEAETIKKEGEMTAAKELEITKIDAEAKITRANADASVKERMAEAELIVKLKEAEGIKALKLAEAEGQKQLVEAWTGDGGKNLVDYERAKRLEGVQVLPLSQLLGGGGLGGGDAFKYQDNAEIMKMLLPKLIEQQKDADK